MKLKTIIRKLQAIAKEHGDNIDVVELAESTDGPTSAVEEYDGEFERGIKIRYISEDGDNEIRRRPKPDHVKVVALISRF